MTTIHDTHRPVPPTHAETELRTEAHAGVVEHLHFDRRTRVWWQHKDRVDATRPNVAGGGSTSLAA